MSNHLIIGLGGTGGKIIRSLKKTIYQEYRENIPSDLFMNYIFIDSNPNMMSSSDPTWKILGQSVQLGKDSQVLISGANLSEHLKEIDKFPGIKPWIGNKDFWVEILNSIQDDAAGGQKRRLGRFLFACSYNLFLMALDKQVKNIVEKSNLTNITFHVCGGLAGGTGSGILIDVISLIREKYSPSTINPYKIILYLLLPDINPPFGWDSGNYFANGYAALMELNSLSVGAFNPCDIRGIKDKVQLINPFNGCYLFTNQNENGMEIDVDKEVPNIISNFLYQKLVSVRNINWESLTRLENAENGDNTPEMSPNSKIGERSKRFLTFGIKRIAFPEDEIKEYMTYNYARQSLLQLRFNNWTDDFGFLEEAKNQDFSEYIRQKENLNNWTMTDQHLCLSLGILPEDISNKKWKPIHTLWEVLMPNFKDHVRSYSAPNWLDELSKLCEKQFTEDYRGLGVKNFYKTKLNSKRDIVKEIRRKVEKDLFDQWRNGFRSLNDIYKIMEALISFTKERLQLLDEKILKSKENEESTVLKIDSNKKEWSDLGFMKKIFGKKENLFDKHSEYLKELYIHQTLIEGMFFAKTIAQEMVSDFEDLKMEVGKCLEIMGEAIKKFSLLINERCKEDKKPDLKAQVVKFYDPEIVKNINNRFVKNEQEQRTQTNKVRSAVISKLGENTNFTAFSERFTINSIIDILETVCEDNVKITHNNLIENQQEKVLGVSIIEKLKQKYEGDDELLREYIAQLVKYAGVYLTFDPLEENKRGAGIPETLTKFSTFTVIIPKAPAYANFVNKLKKAFFESTTSPVEIIESESKINEISIIKIINLFPLRFVSQVDLLREKYNLRIKKSDAEKARMILHLEGDGSQHPRLFVLTTQEEAEIKEKIKDESIPYILLAKSMKQIVEIEDTDTGLKQLYLLRKKKSGVDDEPIMLGNNLCEAFTRVEGIEILNEIKNMVLQKFEKEFTHINSKDMLREGILKEIQIVKELRGGGFKDAIIKKFNQAADFAIEKILNVS